MSWRIGIDIGGTFTDVALVEEASGRIGVAKVPTTPQDPAEGVLRALEAAMTRYAVSAAEVGLLSHATTIVTNAILEEKGAPPSSPRAVFATCWSCAAPRAPTCTTSSRTRPPPWSRVGAGSRSPSASAPMARSSSRLPRTRSTAWSPR
jgi:N-methylhydantoinase A